ncbi:MAG: PIN domain-containing protein [Actinobacteria bacterium]|nr:PIN domain-containing protein [Actinomycetota bacterium]MBU4240607.1 PIN domain-containing protein [Actinomycetota bacterium]MBU4302146.1 PIN domain-containing protein [Actinomycetota bacterium]MBU4489990.1 PIN domain-containing protein [Actinomycetota bacterium]MCG2794975.1 PIN domain-containing protein [Actinomycetes bacterium]
MGTKRDLTGTIEKHRVIGLDTSVFIYQFEGKRYPELTGAVFEAIERGHCRAVVSVISLMEVLVMPLRKGDARLASMYRSVFESMPNLLMVNVTPVIAQKAAGIRAEFNLSTPDSILLATTIDNGSGLFITNEPRLKRVETIEVAVLDEYA